MNGYCDSVLLSITVVRGEGIAPEISVTKSVRIINELENRYSVGFIAQPTELLSHVTVDSAMCREFDSHRLHICLFKRAC